MWALKVHGAPRTGAAIEQLRQRPAEICGARLTSRGLIVLVSLVLAAGLLCREWALSLEPLSAEGRYTYKYARPRLAVDPVVVALPSKNQKQPQVLLVLRKQAPFKGYWGLPGGFVEDKEPVAVAAAREVREETSLDLAAMGITMEQVGVFDDPGRDGTPGWCLGVGFVALVPAAAQQAVHAGDDAGEAVWHGVDVLHTLRIGFDHKAVIREALRHLAAQERVQKVQGLAEQMRKAADKLEGPWQHARLAG